MIAQSDNIPETKIKNRGITQVTYNIREITTTNIDNTTRTVYEYNYVEIEGTVTRSKIITALLNKDYNTNDQIAILFNKAIAKNIGKHDAYQLKRVEAKRIADEIMGSEI